MVESGDILVLPTVRENPFLIDLVVLVMFEETDFETLKTLREMNSDWNHLYIKEMGKRASEGGLSQINFTLDWGDEIVTVEQIQAQLDAFLKDTQMNPQLFKSFYFNFPESFNHCIDPSFLSTYSPAFVKIGVSESVGFPKDQLRHILRLMAPHLVEFKVGHLSEWWIPEVSPRDSSSWTIQAQDSKDMQLVFPKLTTLSSKGCFASNKVCQQLLVSKGGLVDPTPNLHILDIHMMTEAMGSDLLYSIGRSRWTRLTQLNISLNDAECIKLTGNLLSMAQAGMKLKSLGLEIGFAIDWSGICRNLSQFFEFQSKSLETLKFNYRSWPMAEMANMKIRLPVFEKLTSLDLEVYFELHTRRGYAIRQIFQMGSLPVHCPKLINLRVNCAEVLATLYPNDVNAERIHLQKLYIGYFSRDLLSNEKKFWNDWLKSKFASVVELHCPSEMLTINGRHLPWTDSLKVLKITSVGKPLKISRLTELEELYLNEGSCRRFTQNIGEYLGFFHQVRRLKLSKITIVLDEMVPDDVKARFERYFPFPVKYLDRKDYLEGF